MYVVRQNREAVPTRARCTGWCLVCAVVTVLLVVHAYGQGNMQPIHITFDGPPPQPPGTAYTVHEYSEAGIRFDSLTSFGRVGMNPRPASGRPDDGTAYLQALLGDSLRFSFTN